MRFAVTSFVVVFVVFGPSAQAASPFDGVYRGSYTPSGNGNTRCPAGKDFSVNVVDGKFSYAGAGEGERATASIAADGSFSAQSGQRYLQGKIQSGQMIATTSGSRCNYSWSLRKAG